MVVLRVPVGGQQCTKHMLCFHHNGSTLATIDAHKGAANNGIGCKAFSPGSECFLV